MEMTETAPQPEQISPYDHYEILDAEAAGISAKTIGELRARGCPECGEELNAVSTCNKDLAPYVRLSCLQHGPLPLFVLEKGTAYPAKE